MRNATLSTSLKLGLGLLAASALGACTSTGGGDGVGTTLGNFLLYGGATVPAAAPVPGIEVADCPAVTVTDGGAAIRSGGDGAQARSQLAISEVARECVGRDDGAVIVKVGIQVRALMGPGGGSPRFDTPVYLAVTRGDRVLSSRRSRISVVIPPGQFEKSEILVEDGLVVPPGTGEFDIEVGLGSGPKPAAAAGRPARRRAARG